MNNNFGIKYKLKKQIQIKQLFDNGKWFSSFPLKLVFLECELDDSTFKCGFSVAKRNFKRAVDRNYIKRLMREAVRTNKPLIEEKLITKTGIFMLVFTSKELPNLELIQTKFKRILNEKITK